ncbi:ACLY [Lepeophtheirus salmonis]|uniref:ATP citrate synthase n=1 Tax=Lepeophtheirus salmonis TaxID=72036 RepID=A0A7R8D2I1_LEPSM|nr:ACLY [Lepeophtheirus salmonis]CAF3003165.1 ACLY [Lepeophtheirus salmonis]
MVEVEQSETSFSHTSLVVIQKFIFNKRQCQFVNPLNFASVDCSTNLETLPNDHPWLLTEKLVVKPDQLIKRRGKLGLIKINVDYEEVKKWIKEQRSKEQTIGKAKGMLRLFIIEPFLPHESNEESYGGVDVGDVDSKSSKFEVAVDKDLQRDDVISHLLTKVSDDKQSRLCDFIMALYKQYVELYFTYLEINPLVITSKSIYILDLAAKLDATADFICRGKWGTMNYPPPFGRDAFPEEAFIADIDAKTGASLKLTILNPKGRIWTMVAGGGASVIYADTVSAFGGLDELANYGEYSGAPSEQQTYDYARTLLSLMTKENHIDGKVLIIGGGIANFTNVAATFKGIVKALEEFQNKLKEFQVSIFVRRAGPNYQEGLRIMREVGKNLEIPIHVFGPETHMTDIQIFLLPSSVKKVSQKEEKDVKLISDNEDGNKSNAMFSSQTRAIIWGLQIRAVQGMVDFDYICQRTKPSVACMVYPMVGGDSKQNFYWGHKEILIPVYKSLHMTLLWRLWNILR